MKTAYLFAFKESDDGTTYYIVLEGSQYIGEIMFLYRKSLIAGKWFVCNTLNLIYLFYRNRPFNPKSIENWNHESK